MGLIMECFSAPLDGWKVGQMSWDPNWSIRGVNEENLVKYSGIPLTGRHRADQTMPAYREAFVA